MTCLACKGLGTVTVVSTDICPACDGWGCTEEEHTFRRDQLVFEVDPDLDAERRRKEESHEIPE